MDDSQNSVYLGDRLDVVIKGRRTVSSVQDILSDDRLLISAPTVRSTPVPVPDDELVNVIYYRSNGVYSFVAVKTGERWENELQFVEIEMKSPISKYQRRDFVRFDTVLETTVRLVATAADIEGGSRAETIDLIYNSAGVSSQRQVSENDIVGRGYTLDISGGGLAFSSHTRFERNSIVECTVRLPDGKEDIVVDGLITRSDDTQSHDGPRYHMCMQFINLDEHMRRKVVKYIFEEQAKRRQKGME